MPNDRLRTAAQVDREIANARDRIMQERQRMEQLVRERSRITTPDEPMPNSVLSVNLRLHIGGPSYRYVILHVPSKGYYTTGTTADTMFFPTWTELWGWLEGPGVAYRGPVFILESGKVVVPAREI